MGRPEALVDHTVPELGIFAEYLRALRRLAGLTYAELAEEVSYSPAQLKRAASGRYLPPFSLAFSYASVCCVRADHNGLSWVLHLHAEAERAVSEHKRAARRSTVLAKPQLAWDRADLSGAMRDQWAYAGRPSCHQIERVTSGGVSHSTAHMIVTARTIPRDLRQYAAFLQVCGVTGKRMRPWLRAWVKVCGLPKNDVEFARTTRWMSDFGKELYRQVVMEEEHRRLRVKLSRVPKRAQREPREVG
ncbi:helix-turn-helix domain-containing protein [Streptomyces sp. NPDC004596]